MYIFKKVYLHHMNKSLLYFVHLCMRGKDNIISVARYSEGHGANIAFSLAKKDGLQIEVRWQDGDSSTATAFRNHYSDKVSIRYRLNLY